MKKLLLFVQKNHRKVYLVFIFAVSAMAILYVYPGQIQFKYEFQKGKTWQHEDLFAPFTFTILKSDVDIFREKERLKQNKDLFFYKDNEVTRRQLEELANNWKLNPLSDSIKKSDSANVWQALQFVFNRGVLEETQGLENLGSGKLYLVEENHAESFMRNDYFDVAKVNGLLRNSISNKRLASEILTYVMPNVLYHQKKTDDFLNQKLSNVITSRGIVRQNELIVTKGNVVDEEKFLILTSLKRAYEDNLAGDSFPYQLVAGQLIYIIMLLGVLYSFIYYFRESLFNYIGNMNLILFTVVWMVVGAVVIIKINASWLFMVPFPILPIIMRAFFDTRIALFVHIITILLIGYYAPNSFEFFLIEFVAGISAIINVSGLYKRSQLLVAASKIIGVYLLAYSAFVLLGEGKVESEQFVEMGYLFASGFFSLLAFPLIYVYEKLFGQVSDLTLLEMADTNSPLLRQLAQKAPGTFHHSVQVANLAENAALAIGANTLLVRTGALYHDIGKMNAPMFFVENQVTGVNPHDDLAFDESAAIIINHVLDGVKLAKKNRLPDLIVDFIRSHHGTSRVEYFYRQYVKANPDEEGVDELFTYPGPKPFSKETAILMMADSVEAASRSLKEKTAENLDSLIDGIINSQLTQGQFDNANITLKEIADIKQILKRQLANIYHARIEYPEKIK